MRFCDFAFQDLSKSQQIKLDEQLALMLQDELFLRELRGVPEFNPYMQRRSPVPQQGAHGGPSPLSAGSGSGSGKKTGMCHYLGLAIDGD